MKNVKKVIWLVTGLIIGASTIVYAATIFRSEDITYSNSATTKTNVKDSLDELYDLTSNYEFYKPLASLVELGDYISMTPTSTNYVIPSSLTGADNNQTINPSNLNLWRVIKKNEDGTVEVVSEYVSDEEVTFKGRTGYMNYIGVLNQIAAQYTNPKYVEKTRHIGYNGQIEYIIDTSKIDSELMPYNKFTSDGLDPWTCDESKCLCGTDEDLGAGDIKASNDLELLNNALYTLLATNKSGTADAYFLSSRYYAIWENTWGFTLRIIGQKWNGPAWTECWHWNNGRQVKEPALPVRPVLTFKATNIIKSGDGKSAETAYVLE